MIDTIRTGSALGRNTKDRKGIRENNIIIMAGKSDACLEGINYCTSERR